MKYKILFLCTKNSARSQMAEIVANHKADDRFIAYSAGSNPATELNPMTLEVLSKSGFDISEKKPKAMQEYNDMDFDFVITLCDSMRESCPVFPGHPIYAHWGMPDPAEFIGTDEAKLRFFKKTLIEISHRINLFFNLPFDKLDRLAIELSVKEIGTVQL